MQTTVTLQPSSRTEWAWRLAGALSLVLGLSFFVPWNPYIVRTASLDDSWMLALNEVFGKGFQFGRDVVFTYGPWGFLHTRCYHPNTYGWMLFAWTFFAVVFWRVGWVVARQHVANPAAAFVWLVAVLDFAAINVMEQSATLLCIVALLLVHYFLCRSEPLSLTSLALSAAVAWVGLIKFTYLAAAMMVLVPISIDQIRQRKMPTVMGSFLVFFAVLFLLAGQHFSSLAAYLKWSAQVAGGYTDAMSFVARAPSATFGASRFAGSIVLFGASALLFATLFALAEVRARKAMALLPVAAMGGVLFTLFKWGYVRQDSMHSPLATLALLAVSLMCVPALRTILPGRGWGWGIAGAAAIGLLACCESLRAGNGTEALPRLVASMLIDVRPNVRQAVALMRGSTELHGRYDEALAEMSLMSPVPPFEGTVDVYPWNQGIAIANGLKYQPRPVFQSYSAYTPGLADLNARHLRGPTAADMILFGVVTDPYALRHFPAADDGLSWPELLTRYDIRGSLGGYLVLRRSPGPRQFSLTPVRTTSTRFNMKVPVPPTDDGPVWVEVRIVPSLRGKALSFLYKSPELGISVETVRGTTQTYRLVAGTAEAGFLLSPVVHDGNAFADLASPEWHTSLRDEEVRTIALSDDGGPGSGWAYQPDVSVSFYRLKFPSQPIHRRGQTSGGATGG